MLKTKGRRYRWQRKTVDLILYDLRPYIRRHTGFNNPRHGISNPVSISLHSCQAQQPETQKNQPESWFLRLIIR
jgi:hypothetical protein